MNFVSMRQQCGFSLVEMAVVLVIMGLLLAVVTSPLRAQRTAKYQHQTEAGLLEIKQALLGHALIYGYLPCPDSKASPDGWESANVNGTCVSDDGVLPWQSLGVAKTDAWQRLWRYHVDASFSHHQVHFGFAQATQASSIEVQTDIGTATSNASRPVAVVLSHGENGLGALLATDNGEIQRMSAPISAQEQENADGDVNFVDIGASTINGINTYDDMLMMLSPKVLIAQMVQAQRLP